MPLNIDIQQIFLHLFNFVILGGGLYLLLYKPVTDFMHKREEYYTKLDNDKNAALQSAKEKEEEYSQKLSDIDTEISEKKSQAVKDTEKLTEMQIQKAQEEAQLIIENAKATAKKEHDKILNETREEIAQLAAQTARKLMESEDTYSQFVKAASQGDDHE